MFACRRSRPCTSRVPVHLPEDRMARPRIVLAGLSPSLQGLQWESDTRLRIGRHDSADIVLRDPSLARHQAEIVIRRGKWAVRDLARNERQTTHINGRTIG